MDLIKFLKSFLAEAEGAKMTKKERVDAVIATGRTPFTAASAAVLEALPEEELKALEDAVVVVEEGEEVQTPPVTPTPAVTPPAPVAAAATPAPVPAPKVLSEDEYLAQAPESVKQIVQAHKAASAKRRTDLLTALAASKQDAYTKAELEALPLEALEKVARLAAVPSTQPIDQSGRPLPRAAAGEDEAIPAPPSLRERFAAAAGKKA